MKVHKTNRYCDCNNNTHKAKQNQESKEKGLFNINSYQSSNGNNKVEGNEKWVFGGNSVPRSCRAPAAHGARGSCRGGGAAAAMRMIGGGGGTASAARRSAAADRSAWLRGDTQHELKAAARTVGVWRSPP